jgi:DNA-binding transcriptional LysR family regulator
VKAWYFAVVELNQLRSLVAVSELGRISQAADHLHRSPSAIHKQLKLLESELEVQLYEKVGKRLQLTQAAEVLLPFLKGILAQYDSALSAMAEWKGNCACSLCPMLRSERLRSRREIRVEGI